MEVGSYFSSRHQLTSQKGETKRAPSYFDEACSPSAPACFFVQEASDAVNTVFIFIFIFIFVFNFIFAFNLFL